MFPDEPAAVELKSELVLEAASNDELDDADSSALPPPSLWSLPVRVQLSVLMYAVLIFVAYTLLILASPVDVAVPGDSWTTPNLTRTQWARRLCVRVANCAVCIAVLLQTLAAVLLHSGLHAHLRSDEVFKNGAMLSVALAGLLALVFAYLEDRLSYQLVGALLFAVGLQVCLNGTHPDASSTQHAHMWCTVIGWGAVVYTGNARHIIVGMLDSLHEYD